MNQEVNIVWRKCVEVLKDNLTPTVFNTWFAALEAHDFHDNTLVLRVKSQFVAQYIEENYIDLLSRVIRRFFGSDTQLEYRVLVDSTSGTATTYPSESTAMPAVLPVHTYTNNKVTNWDTQLNENYTFANFVAGETNKLARTAAVAIAKEPGKTVFNPLFIYGGSGVGKTHLANAIGNQIARMMNTQRVLYVSANTFKLQFQDAHNQNKIPEFLLFYQGVDVLIIDDIQFFAGLKGTQDTFFHIFNYLHQMRKQLILTSDCSPLQLHDVEERLLTRFKWGLSVEIKRPDRELRRNILIDKMRRDGIELSDEIIDYITDNACQNVRDIEGILASLMAYATLMESEITMDLAKQVVSRLVPVYSKEIAIEDIVGAVCEHTNIPEKSIKSRTREKSVVLARQMIVYLSKELTDRSYLDISAKVGKRSHATLIYAYNTIKEQMTYDKVLRHDIQLLEYELKK